MFHTPPTRRKFLAEAAAGLAGASLAAHLAPIQRAFASEVGALSFDPSHSTSVRALRDRYMLADGLSYLNHASIGTVPRPVHEAHVAYLTACESHPSVYVWGDVWHDAKDHARAQAAELLRCEPADLAITHNTTEGFNILAHGLPLGPGDEVLFSSLNHPGASQAWWGVAPQRGFSVRSFDFPVARGPELSAAEVVEVHEAQIRPATRVLVFPHVDNMIGLRHPMAEIVEMARARGVEFVVVDGAQSAGMIPLDLPASGVDAYAMSPHKWIQSPKGLGLFYAREAVRGRLKPMWYRYGVRRYGGTAAMYEDYSTRAWPAVVTLGNALDFQAALGQDAKVRRYRDIRRRVRDEVDARPGLVWRSPRPWGLGASLMAVEVRGRSAREVGAWLASEHRTDVRAFSPPLNTIRISPNVANTDEEIGALLDRLEAAAAP